MRFFLTIFLFTTFILPLGAQNLSVLVIAGGHSFDTLAFQRMFDEMENIEYDFMLQPEANRFLVETEEFKYNVLIFYDMWRTIGEQEKSAYLRLCEKGVPMLFLHHALVSYQNWPEFEDIIGGKYVEPPKNEPVPKSELSTYRHDVWVNVRIPDPNHPVTRGMKDFLIFDEVYGNYRVGEKVKPLLTTDHPESTPVIAWENRYKNSRIIYLQPGHDKNAYADENYRRLISQTVRYLSENQ
jgi:uncharacterized protein